MNLLMTIVVILNHNNALKAFYMIKAFIAQVGLIDA